MRKYLMAGAATAALVLGLNQVMAQAPTGGADKNPAASSQAAPAKPGGASTDMKRDSSKTVGQSQSRDEKSDLKAAPSNPSSKMGAGASDELKKSDAGAKSKMTTGQAKDENRNAMEPGGKGKSDKMTTGQSKDNTLEPNGKGTAGSKTTTGQSKDENRNTMEPGGKMEKGAQAPSSSSTKMGQQPSTNQNNAQGSSNVTTGSTASGTVQLNDQQRTEIREHVLTSAPRLNSADFDVRVGVSVPRTVRVEAVPETLIRIHPEWRRHRFFVVNDEIIIVDNDFRIIAIVQV
jgi:hypothetical protein